MARLVPVEREHEPEDVLIGSRLRICDDETGKTYSEGVVAAVDVVKEHGERREFLRMDVEKRVINGRSVEDFLRELAVDCEIPMHLVTLLGRSDRGLVPTSRKAVVVMG